MRMSRGEFRPRGTQKNWAPGLRSPPPQHETMKKFASWVRADVSRKDEVASVAFLRFMAGRFPC